MNYQRIIQEELNIEESKILLRKQIETYERVKNTNANKECYEVGQAVFFEKRYYSTWNI